MTSYDRYKSTSSWTRLSRPKIRTGPIKLNGPDFLSVPVRISCLEWPEFDKLEKEYELDGKFMTDSSSFAEILDDESPK